MVIKHLYQRTITHKGKKVKAWYYWYYDANNKQVRKSCGQHGKPCLLKREAEQFIANLPEEIEIDKSKITFNQFCQGFYNPDSRFMIKQKNRGEELAPNTIYQRQHYLITFLEQFGEMYVDEVDGSDFDNWLLSLNYCVSVRNHMQKMIEEIEKELYSYHLIKSVPLLERYKRNDTKPKGTLTPSEIRSLFPDNYDELIKIWKVPNSLLTEADNYTYATMIYTLVSTGLRSCEIRAINWNQFIEKDVLLINAMINSEKIRTNKLKKGTKENKKWRVVVLPDRTSKMINDIKILGNYNPERVFWINGKEVTTYFLLDHLHLVLQKNGIDTKERNIGVHSLRFTYNTIMRPEIDEKDLRLMVGHVSKEMTDYYDMSKVQDNIPMLIKNKDKINNVWN